MAAQILNLPIGQLTVGLEATIASGGTKSGAIHLAGRSLVGIQFATMSGTAMTFEVSDDGLTFVPLKSTTSGSALSYTIASNQYNAIDPTPFQGVNYLKCVSGSTEGADRVLKLSVKG